MAAVISSKAMLDEDVALESGCSFILGFLCCKLIEKQAAGLVVPKLSIRAL